MLSTRKQHQDYNRRHQVPNKIKVDQKELLKNQRGMDGKDGKFPCKWFGQFAVHLISNKNLSSLINKDGTLIKTKYNVSLLEPYFDSDQAKVTCNEKPPPSATHEKPQVDAPPSLMNKQILIEQMIDNYVITNLPNEIIISSKNSTETYAILS